MEVGDSQAVGHYLVLRDVTDYTIHVKPWIVNCG